MACSSEMITIRFAGWISCRIVSLQPDKDVQKLLSNGNQIKIRISETLLSIFRGFRLLEKDPHCIIIRLLSSEASFRPSVPWLQVCLWQGFPNWSTCTPRGTFAYRKGYISSWQLKGKICLYIIHSQLFISVSVVSIRINFSKGDNAAIFFTLFRVLSMQCKWMFTNHFTLFTTQRKCPMLWQQWQKMPFVGSHSQVYYDNCFHHRISADIQNRALLFTEVAYCYYD